MREKLILIIIIIMGAVMCFAEIPEGYKVFDDSYAGPAKGRTNFPLRISSNEKENRDPDYTAYAYNAWDPSDEYEPGLLSFTLNDPGSFDYIAETTTSEMIAAATYVEDTIFGIEFYTGYIYTISEEGVFSYVGNSGIGADAIAYDATTGTLFAIDHTDLYEINQETGLATLIGPIGNNALMIAMTCDNDGNLFGIDMTDDNLYAVNKETGAGTIVGALGIDINFAQDMDYDRDGEACYLAAMSHDFPSTFYSIDLETGQASYIGPIDNGMEITGLAIPYGLSSEIGWITGNVTLQGGSGNVEDVEITAGSVTANPSSNGDYSIELDVGTYNVTAYLTGYDEETVENILVEDGIITENIDFTLEEIGSGTQIPGGSISGTWNNEGSPYFINGEVTIPNGETLIIEPDVTVNFQGHYKFIVDGRLLAIGTEEDMIKFTADDTNVGWYGIRFQNTSATNDSSKIVYCEIEHGSAYGGTGNTDGAGGGIAIIGFNKVLVSHCDIHDNHADQVQYSPGGGGIVIRQSDAVITRNRIYNNTTSTAGGGIFVYDGSNPTISYNLIYNNYSEWDGGGIECYHECSPEIFNNTIVYNDAGEAGGGINFFTNCSPNLTNNIILGNTALYGDQAFLYTNNVAPNFYYNNIQGGFDGIGLNYGVTFEGDYENNIDENPLFVSVPNNDFHLMEGSPCIDAGDPSFPFDPDETISDIGALYYNQGTSIHEELLPSNEGIRLSNYPNPFNPSTTISFSSKQNEQYELTIYNLKGQRVKTFSVILSGVEGSTGLHSVVWNGTDDNGKSVSSGIYFYKLKTGSFEQTKKMILLK